jgi:hypothetical protein
MRIREGASGITLTSVTPRLYAIDEACAASFWAFGQGGCGCPPSRGPGIHRDHLRGRLPAEVLPAWETARQGPGHRPRPVVMAGGVPTGWQVDTCAPVGTYAHVRVSGERSL